MKDVGDDSYLQLIRIFVLVVCFLPLIGCAGCFGLAIFSSLFPAHGDPSPRQTVATPQARPTVPQHVRP